MRPELAPLGQTSAGIGRREMVSLEIRIYLCGSVVTETLGPILAPSQREALCLGLFGVATGLGAALSTALGGSLAEHYGAGAACLTLAGCNVGAVLAAYGTAPGCGLSSSPSPAASGASVDPGSRPNKCNI